MCSSLADIVKQIGSYIQSTEIDDVLQSSRHSPANLYQIMIRYGVHISEDRIDHLDHLEELQYRQFLRCGAQSQN